MMNINFPSDDMVWATAATKNATTWGHIDDHGMDTIAKVMAGKKYWVTMRPKRKQDESQGGSNGDMGSIKAFIDGWEPWGAGELLWDHEAVLLQAGDLLYASLSSYKYLMLNCPQLHEAEHHALCVDCRGLDHHGPTSLSERKFTRNSLWNRPYFCDELCSNEYSPQQAVHNASTDHGHVASEL